jgi:hypothetical protein
VSKTEYLERFWAAQHLLGRAVAPAARAAMWAGRGVETMAASHSATVRESPFLRKTVRFLSMGALTAAVAVPTVAWLAHITPTVALALVVKKVAFGLAGYGTFKYGSPLMLSKMRFFQRHPKALVFARELLGWTGFGVGWAVAPHISGHTMHDLHMQSPDERVDETARHALAYQIDQRRGAPMFLHIDHGSDQALRDQLAATASDDETLRNSPDLSRIWRNLDSFKTQSAFLKNDQAAFVRQGVDLMQDLRTQEGLMLHGGRYDVATLQHLAVTRSQVRAWNEHFATVAGAAEEEYRKGFIPLVMELANTQPVHTMSPLSYYLANPATLSEIRIAHGGLLTPQDIVTTADRIHGRWLAINQVVVNYERASAHCSMKDTYYGGLIGARGEYAYWDERVHQIAAMTRGMPVDQPIIVRSEIGQGLTNAEILNAVHQTDFSRYGSAWGQVMAADHHVQQVGPQQTLVDGKIMPFRKYDAHHGIVPFKDDVYSDLAPTMRADLAHATLKLEADGYTPRITEGWKLTDPGAHVSACHFHGTCVDVGGPSSGQEIYTYFKDLNPTARRLLLEAHTPADRNHFQQMLWNYLTEPKGSFGTGGLGMSREAAEAWIRQYVDSKGGIEYVKHATAANWHYEPLNGEAPIVPVDLNQEPGL